MLMMNENLVIISYFNNLSDLHMCLNKDDKEKIDTNLSPSLMKKASFIEMNKRKSHKIHPMEKTINSLL
jgi:hypothetical protein